MLARQKLDSKEVTLPPTAEKTLASQPISTPTPQPERLPVTAMPVKRQVVHGIYGAAANHSWLQGTVESLGNEGAILRYAHPWTGGTDAFRVLLNSDERLKGLRVGDVIRVEGDELENPRNRALPLYQLKSLSKVSLDS